MNKSDETQASQMKLAFGTLQQDNDTSDIPQPKPRFPRRWLRLLLLSAVRISAGSHLRCLLLLRNINSPAQFLSVSATLVHPARLARRRACV